MICSQYQEYALGYEFGNLAIQLAEKLQSPVQRCRSTVFMYSVIYAWSKPIQHLPDLLTSAYEACLVCGEIEYAGYCAVKVLFDQGTLSKLQQETLAALNFIHSTKNKGVINYIMRGYQRLLANLMGETQSEVDFNYAAVSEAEFIADCQKSASGTALGLYHICKAQALYLYGYFEQALQTLELARSKLACMPGFYAVSIFNWYDSLIRLALYPKALPAEQQSHLHQIAQNQQQMQSWQNSCTENFAHKYHLVAAELARVKSDYATAEEYYERAIELAGQHGFIQEQALAAELATQHWLTRGRSMGAQGYINTAFNGYKQWGGQTQISLA